jgi:acylphosphatase
MKQKRATVYFKGRVLGVWFRVYTKQQADRQQVSGWVRNRLDGSVEALFEGAESTVKSLISTCQNGPPSARVEEITIEWQAATGEFSSFEILH